MKNASKFAALALIVGLAGALASTAMAADTADTTWQKTTPAVSRSTSASPTRTHASRPKSKKAI